MGNQNLRAESPRRPPRRRRDAGSMAWRCRFSPLDRPGRVAGDLVKGRRAPGALVDFHKDETLKAPGHIEARLLYGRER